ncbi:MAG TPA: adenylate/guanylate cyclase domain-containing protein [Actinomycetota bacterium]|nr:adenylate/guanylate cyclase domain-containing protein [Actinomycetota bacterium]
MGVSRRTELPAGTVTLMLTDIEGSTRLLAKLGAEEYGRQLVAHRDLVRAILLANQGVEVDTEGDAFFVAFSRAPDAAKAARDIHRAMEGSPIRLRIGLHTGHPELAGGGYIGMDVHMAARICAAGHGGQTVLSEPAHHLGGSPGRDLGMHRLKDFPQPVRLYQLELDEFPPIRTLKLSNLPAPVSPLLGRARELQELTELAQAHRLLTLTGPGGIGKTRLALELASRLAGVHEHGVWWVPLEGVPEPGLVVAAVSDSLGMSGRLDDYLATRNLLLVLDNIEHLIDAAPDLSGLLERAPGLRLIVTSRQRLALDAEQEYPIAPLDQREAAELFRERARRVRPGFELDAAAEEICERLDRLPLALELAATRVKLMTPEQILGRLERRLDFLAGAGRDRSQRQLTMRAAIGWSYELLDPEEQRCFRALGAFPSTFDVDAAEAVCTADLEAIASLVDKSLLQQTEPGRFSLLATTRDYALEQLDSAGEAAEVSRRHSEWFLGLVQTASRSLGSSEWGAWVARLRVEADNLRAAMTWALDFDVDAAAHASSVLTQVWYTRGHFAEPTVWLRRLLARRAELDYATEMAALVRYANGLFFCNQFEDAEVAAREVFELAIQTDDWPSAGSAENVLGCVLWARGDVAGSVDAHKRALELHRRADDKMGVARSLHMLGERLRDYGDLDSATSAILESIDLKRLLGDEPGVVFSLHSLADTTLDEGALKEAARRYVEAMRRALELRDERGITYCVAGLASVAARAGEHQTAATLWARAEQDEERLGFRILHVERARYEAAIAPILSDPAFVPAEDCALDEVIDSLIDVLGDR